MIKNLAVLKKPFGDNLEVKKFTLILARANFKRTCSFTIYTIQQLGCRTASPFVCAKDLFKIFKSEQVTTTVSVLLTLYLFTNTQC